MLLNDLILPENGHFIQLAKKKKSLFETSASLSLDFSKFEKHCLEFYYQYMGNLPVKISVNQIDENLQVHGVSLNNQNYVNKKWNRHFAFLRDGIYSLEIQATLKGSQSTGIAIDDILIDKCEQFSE